MDFGMSGDDLEQMYQEVILEASRNPHGRERFAPDLASEQSAQAGESVVRASHEYCAAGESLVWDGHGCSISQASLSIMVDLVEGKTVDEAMRLTGLFHQLMDSRGAGLSDESAEEDLGDAVVFQGVSKYPMRIKCALLGWEGMKASVAEALARMQ